MNKKPIFVGKPVEGAPYTPAIVAGGFVYVSGQLPIEPGSGELVRGDIERATALCIANVQKALEAAGSSLENCVKVTVFLKDMDQFGAVNGVYRNYFGDVKPARSCIQIARLPLDADIEIEAIALA